MRDSKIGTRLEVGFAIVIALAVAFGAFAYNLAANTDQINLSPVYLSEDLRSNIQTQYALLQQYLTTQDEAEAARLETALSAAHVRNADLVAKYAVLPQSEKQKTSFQTLKVAREAYGTPFAEVLALNKGGSEESKRQAQEINSQQVRPGFSKYLESADGLVSTTRRAAEEQHQSVEAGIATTSTRILSGLGVAVLFLVVTAYLIIRSVTKPLADAVEVLDQVSEGDLNCRANVTSGDEIGQVMKALNRLLDNQWNAAGIAERMAEGDLSVHLNALPERDILGRALARMRNNLQASIEAAEKLAEGEVSGQPRLLAENDKLGHTLVRLRDSLRASVETAEKLAQGQVAVEITPVSDKDAFRKALLRMRDYQRSTLAVVEKISEGDLTVAVKAAPESDVVGTALARMVESLRLQLRAIATSVSSLAEMGKGVMAGAEQLSLGCHEHVPAAAATASALGGVRAALQQNANYSQETDKLAAAAAEDGRLTGEALSQTAAAMKEVAEKIGVLDEIARKTDLLTLSAAVEAARAGEHGMGFGVLTTELRRLGERSQTAASEMVRASMGGVKTADSAGELLGRLVPSVSRTADLVREMAVTSVEQSAGATRLDEAVQQMDRTMQQSVAAAHEISAAAAELVSQAGILRSGIGFFKLEDVAVVEAVPEVMASRSKVAGS